MATFSIIPATDEHAVFLSNYLRPREIEEVRKLGWTPYGAFKNSMDESIESFTFLVNNTPCAIFGIGYHNIITTTPYTWVLSSSLIDKYLKTYIKGIRVITDEWLDKYTSLYGVVDDTYIQAKKLFIAAGFTEHEPLSYNGNIFRIIMKDKKYGCN